MSSESNQQSKDEFADSYDESIQSVKIAKYTKDTESAEVAKIDVSEGFVELLTLTTDTMINEGWQSSAPGLIKTVRTIEADMNKLYQYVENSPDAKPDDSTVLAQIYMQMSTFYHNPHFKKEKLYIADAYLTRCLKLLKGKVLDRKTIIIAMRAYFELSCLWWKLENVEKSKLYIFEVLKLYKSYTQEKDDYPVPICILTIIGRQTERHLIKLDEMYWKASLSISLFLNKYLEEKDKNIPYMYMHKILKKYLKIVPSIMKRVEWAEHAMALAKLLLMSDRFAEAKGHIAAAAFVMKQFYNEECAQVDVATLQKEHTALNEQYTLKICKINLCWAWYGIGLLSASRRFKRNSVEDASHEANDSQSVSVIRSTKLQFINLEKELQEFIVLDKDTYITNYIDAKATFQAVLNRLNEVKIYIEKNNTLELYVDLIRCTSKVYKYLTYYEHKENIIELHEKRIAALRDITKSFSAANNRYLYGYISLELAIATSTLLDVKIDSLPIGTNPMNSLEIKELVNANMQSLQLYLHNFFE